MRGEVQVPARARRELDLLGRPLGARPGIVVQPLRREAVEEPVVGRMHGNELPLEMRGQLRDLDAALRHPALQVIAIVPAPGGLGDVDEGGIADRHLNALEAEVRGPARHGLDVVERVLVRHELGEEDRGALESLHVVS